MDHPKFLIALAGLFLVMTGLDPAKAAEQAVSGSHYTGSDKCADCHPEQFRDWQDSHHALSMQEAVPATVLADFNNVSFKNEHIDILFHRDKGEYMARTAGPGGQVEDFPIRYTFGITPLQEYIVAFPRGRFQVLPVAWDTLKKEWFFVQASQNPEPEEWIHWTGGGMNWNGMCADCHSTNVKKNYSPGKDSYGTTFSAINVGCEACHGPGSTHVDRVTQPGYQAGQDDPALDMGTGEDPKVLVDKCGRCHAWRRPVAEAFKHNSDQLLDYYLPAVLRDDLYYSDGQIKEEVFVYGSYLQSWKYQQNVSCLNCHDPHRGIGICFQRMLLSA
ncbi:MAG: multiheme c-type cytochrome [Gammaproteobacteria bacterium]